MWHTQGSLYLQRDKRFGIRIRQTLHLPWKSQWHWFELQIQWSERGQSPGLKAWVCSSFLLVYILVWLTNNYQVENAATWPSKNSSNSSPTSIERSMKGCLRNLTSFIKKWVKFLRYYLPAESLILASTRCQWCPKQQLEPNSWLHCGLAKQVWPHHLSSVGPQLR